MQNKILCIKSYLLHLVMHMNFLQIHCVSARYQALRVLLHEGIHFVFYLTSITLYTVMAHCQWLSSGD